MKQLYRLAVLVIGVSVSQGAAADFPANPIEKDGWELVLSEEFNGPVLDISLWIPEYNPLWFDPPRRRMPHSFVTDKGARALRMTIPTDKSFSRMQGMQTYFQPQWHLDPPWNAPYIDKFTHLFGWYEVRSRQPVSITGSHAAWWILEADVHGGEIDVYEDSRWGGPNFHIPTGGSNPSGKYPMRQAADYKVYAMEIYADGVRFYFDNELIRDTKINWASRGMKPFGHIFSMYAEDNQRGVEHEYYLDYFRVYKKPETVAPAAASMRYPQDGMNRVGRKTHLCWAAGERATTHSVRFGTTQTPPIVSNGAAKFYYAGELKPNTTYYWSVEEVNAAGVAGSPTYSFTTGPGYVMEARSMRGSNYLLSANKDFLRLDSSNGKATEWFDGPSGSYDVCVEYLDEQAGISTWELRVDETAVQSWEGKTNDGSWHTETVKGVRIESDSRIDIAGTGGNGSAAAFSRISFIPPVSTRSSRQAPLVAPGRTAVGTPDKLYLPTGRRAVGPRMPGVLLTQQGHRVLIARRQLNKMKQPAD